MAKQQRRTTKRPGAKPSKAAASRKAKTAPKPAAAGRASASRPTPKSARAAQPPARRRAAQSPAQRNAGRPAGPTASAASPTPPPAPRKPGFYEAVAIYERGVQALQRHDYRAAADLFRTVLERYPEERELLERARLYLRVCERETARQPQGPRTPAERVYAATVALNSGDHAGALDQLQRALSEDPDSDHAHYTMAVALGMRGRTVEALDHLRSAIGLNPENRALARQDPDLEAVRGHASFRSVLDTPAFARRRTKPRR